MAFGINTVGGPAGLGCGVLAIASLYCGGNTALPWIVAAVILGSAAGVYLALFTDSKNSTELTIPEACHLLGAATAVTGDCTTNSDVRAIRRQPTVITRSVDAAIDELMDLTLRDFVRPWLEGLVNDCKSILDGMKWDSWLMIQNARDRFYRVDQVKLMTQDVISCLTGHLQNIRLASGESQPFVLRPYLQTDEMEMEFLRKVSELLVVCLAPGSYRQSMPVRHLLREVVACSVLYPTIAMVCDPDFLNQKLLDFIIRHQAALERQQRKYEYTANYEDFIKMIQESTDIEHLKHMRSNIATEIKQATTVGESRRGHVSTQSTMKVDLLQARNRPRYINQLTFAKSMCDKRVQLLGGGSAEGAAAISSPDDLQYTMSGRKVLPFHAVMSSAFARQFLMKFLEKQEMPILLEFYNAVEEMKTAEKRHLHQLAGQIFQEFIPYLSNVLKLERGAKKAMEAFIIGNRGPEAFFEAQCEVSRVLEERFYPSFIVCGIYHEMLVEADKRGERLTSAFDTQETDIGKEVDESTTIDITEEPGSSPPVAFADQLSAARLRLQQLSERLINKIQALEAVRLCSKLTDPRIIPRLENEIKILNDEKQELELHVKRTEAWVDHFGQWHAYIHSIEYIEEVKERNVPYFLLVVQLKEDEDSSEIIDGDSDGEEEEAQPSGWLVKRRVTDVLELHRALLPISAALKTVELPKEPRLKGKPDEATLERTTALLQNYLDMILLDDRLCRCESVYSFFSPTPESLKQSLMSSPKKSRFSFGTLFKSMQSGIREPGALEEEDYLFLDELDGSGRREDPIAEPLYALISEIFELRGVAMLLRRTLMSFVQVTFGRTISKQLRESVAWMFSESMLIYYIHIIRDSLWPDGRLYPSQLPRSDEEKLDTRYNAKQQLLANIPDSLVSLVGQQNARRGVTKMFECLQDARLNKQLLYELIELVAVEVFPELKKTLTR